MEVSRFLRKFQRRAQLTEWAAELLLQDEQTHSGELDERGRYLKHCLKALSPDQLELLEGYYHHEHSVSELSKQRAGRWRPSAR